MRAGLEPGDLLRVEATGKGELELRRADADWIEEFAGSMDGVYVSSDRHHEVVARDLAGLDDRPIAVSVITYAEVTVGAVRSGPSAGEKLERFWRRVTDSIEPVSREIAGRSAEIRAATPSLKLPDALIVATGVVLEATAVLTTDTRWAAASPLVRVLGT